jgi:hypothetical protein
VYLHPRVEELVALDADLPAYRLVTGGEGVESVHPEVGVRIEVAHLFGADLQVAVGIALAPALQQECQVRRNA